MTKHSLFAILAPILLIAHTVAAADGTGIAHECVGIDPLDVQVAAIPAATG